MRLRIVSSALLAVLFILTPLVKAQQPADISSDDRHDAKLAIYQVHRIAEKILSLRNARVKALETARLAALLWKQDETHARSLFEKALNLTTVNGNDPDARSLSVVHQRVIALIARTDPDWSKRLIQAAAKRDSDDLASKTINTANIRTALSLVEEDATVAAQFAERSLKGGLHPAFLDFIVQLRKHDEPQADRLFLQALSYLSQQPTVNITEFHSLGQYLFTGRGIIEPDARMLTLVGDILVPNITIDRPGVSRALVRAYLATAADVLWKVTSDSEQRKYSYALCYMLLPKTRNVAPDLTGKFDAVMAALAPKVPTALTNESAYRYLNAVPGTVEERLTKAENQPDQEGRDLAYLEIVLQSWRKGDFKTARIAQGRISDLEASQRLAAIIDFGTGAWAMKQNSPDLARAEAMADRLPQGIERSILLQAIATVQRKGADRHVAEETVDKALKAARSVRDGRRPFLLLAGAAQLADLKSASLPGATTEAVKDFNSFEESAFTKLDWAESVQIGPLKARFPLDLANVDFGFNEAFRRVAVADPEAALARAEELRHENLRAQSLVEVAKAFLETVPPRPSTTNTTRN